MSAEQQLAKIKEQNRVRQKRHYDKNREMLNAKRRAIYAQGVAARPQPEPVPEPEPTTHKTDFSKSKSITYEQAIHGLSGLEINPNTASKYNQDLKRLMSITDCANNIIKCFKEYKKLIDVINSSVKPDGTPYSVNTRKSLYQMILYIIDHLHLPITKKIKEHYLNQFNTYKVMSNDVTTAKQETAPIHTFDEYLKKVKKEFGADSKEFVLSSLYKEITLRDDYVLLIASSIKSTEKDDSKNYIVATKKGDLTMIINQYKTSKYGQIKVKLSVSLSKLIRKYIESENLEIGDYLFGSKNLSSFVSTMNKKIGVSGAINTYRHMSVSDLLSKEPSAEARVALSAQMKHSPMTQIKYLRKNI